MERYPPQKKTGLRKEDEELLQMLAEMLDQHVSQSEKKDFRKFDTLITSDVKNRDMFNEKEEKGKRAILRSVHPPALTAAPAHGPCGDPPAPPPTGTSTTTRQDVQQTTTSSGWEPPGEPPWSQGLPTFRAPTVVGNGRSTVSRALVR